jgi:hypothetical protein
MKEAYESILGKINPKSGDGKKWTIMVYLAGSNNLVDEMIFAVRELRGKAITNIVNIFVEFDSGSDVWLFPPSAFQQKPGEDLKKLQDLDLEKIGEREHYPRLINTQGILRRFVTNSMLRSPDTEHYMLILSGHGSGAVGDFLVGNTPGLTVPSLGITFDRVKAALARRNHPRGKSNAKLFDILGLDSCTMSMAEVGYEVERHVSYMIGAEGFELNTGWPYDRLIELDLQKTPCELASDIVQTYSEYYFNYSIGDLSTDQSAVKLDGFRAALEPIIKELARVLSDCLNERTTREAILVAHWKAQSYKGEQYTDLWDFCGELKERFPEYHPVYSRAQAVQNAIEGVVIMSTYSGARFQHSHGLAVYFPWADIVDSKGGHDLSAYRLLRFANQTDWADFLAGYLKTTRRGPRYVDGEDVPKTSHLNARPGLFGTLAEVTLEIAAGQQGKGGGDDDSKGGGDDDDSKGGGDDDDSKGGGDDDDSKSSFSDETKGGGDDDDSKSAALLLGLKIGQMKNPPVVWFPKNMPKEIQRARDACKK